MQLEVSGNKSNLDLSIEDALILQEQLAKAIRFALKHRESNFSTATYTRVNGQDTAGVLTVSVAVE